MKANIHRNPEHGKTLADMMNDLENYREQASLYLAMRDMGLGLGRIREVHELVAAESDRFAKNVECGAGDTMLLEMARSYGIPVLDEKIEEELVRLEEVGYREFRNRMLCVNSMDMREVVRMIAYRMQLITCCCLRDRVGWGWRKKLPEFLRRAAEYRQRDREKKDGGEWILAEMERAMPGSVDYCAAQYVQQVRNAIRAEQEARVRRAEKALAIRREAEHRAAMELGLEDIRGSGDIWGTGKVRIKAK